MFIPKDKIMQYLTLFAEGYDLIGIVKKLHPDLKGVENIKAMKSRITSELNRYGFYIKEIRRQCVAGVTAQEIYDSVYKAGAGVEAPVNLPIINYSPVVEDTLISMLNELKLLRMVADKLIDQRLIDVTSETKKARKKPKSAYRPNNLKSPAWSSDELQLLVQEIDARKPGIKVMSVCEDLLKIFSNRTPQAIHSRYYKAIRDKGDKFKVSAA